MTDVLNKLNGLIISCWRDDSLKQRFLNDPHAVLAEHGIDVSDDANVNVVENTDSTVHISLPAPPEGNASLEDIWWSVSLKWSLLGMLKSHCAPAEFPVAMNACNAIIAACLEDDAFKQRVRSDPYAAFAEHGIEVPESINLLVLENTNDTRHIALPSSAPF